MLYNISFKDKDIEKKINDLVGEPYHLGEVVFKKKGIIGSSRMEIVEHSLLFEDIMKKSKQAIFASISLRPNGILVLFNLRQTTYAWPIPYHYLSVFKTQLLVIHGQGQFLKLKIKKTQNKTFIKKMLALKSEHNGDEYYG
ncbi:hypothetical protein CW751_06675 [Brumimicrobium salinarum]|uniref:YokE-like PH domain-containing protein n=1 Tax=Brumimicrobium salinarum TaxID=2058658 RepID=A0A2I0R3A6_9FLAO|nr:hypothetical protein [Brumimicrobium salinarum]PKR81056.1 hypothetical protein CW751_06675 [Brumimicrobium salinarum]